MKVIREAVYPMKKIVIYVYNKICRVHTKRCYGFLGTICGNIKCRKATCCSILLYNQNLLIEQFSFSFHK